MEDLPYSVGTIKSTWIDKEDSAILNSSMSKSVEEALNKIPKNNKNWLLFRLETTNGTDYTWKMLPYGQNKLYVTAYNFKTNPILYYGSLSLMIFGAYSVIRMIGK